MIIKQMHGEESITAIRAHKVFDAFVEFTQMLTKCVTVRIRFAALMAYEVALAGVQFLVLLQ